jgi:type IV pilus assembly protein PilX
MRYKLFLLADKTGHLEKGIVLFFALLALAVMSIAAVALIRSVDTNALLSGNMVFRQSASTASNVAIEGVTENIAKNILLADSIRHQPQLGYYANCSQFDTQPNALICDGSTLTTMVWDDANSSLVPSQTDGNDEIRNGVDRQGNEIRYIVERMCSYNDAEINAGAGAADAARCLMANSPSNVGNCSHNIANIELYRRCIAASDSPLYRVTLRIAGPKNTLTFMQSFISN